MGISNKEIEKIISLATFSVLKEEKNVEALTAIQSHENIGDLAKDVPIITLSMMQEILTKTLTELNDLGMLGKVETE